jgi:hypothetical protein
LKPNLEKNMPTVTASSFADPADLRAFQRAKAQGMSDQEAFAHGDNCIGLWGDFTGSEDVCMCALPPEDWLSKWGSSAAARGRQVRVTHRGHTVIGELRDTMPHKAKIRNGAGIDLNPGFARALAVNPPFMLPNVDWEWVE